MATNMQDNWKRGLGSPCIMLTDHEMSLPRESERRKSWAEFDSVFRREFNRDENRAAFKRLAVAILNTGMVETGQLFEIDADGQIIESHVVQDKLRELIVDFMTR